MHFHSASCRCTLGHSQCPWEDRCRFSPRDASASGLDWGCSRDQLDQLPLEVWANPESSLCIERGRFRWYYPNLALFHITCKVTAIFVGPSSARGQDQNVLDSTFLEQWSGVTMNLHLSGECRHAFCVQTQLCFASDTKKRTARRVGVWSLNTFPRRKKGAAFLEGRGSACVLRKENSPPTWSYLGSDLWYIYLYEKLTCFFSPPFW